MKINILIIAIILTGCVSYNTGHPDIKNQTATEYKFSVCGGSGFVFGGGTQYSMCLDKALAKWHLYHAEDNVAE